MHGHQSLKLPRVFESLPDSVAVAMGIMKPASPTTHVVQIYRQGKAVEKKPQPIASATTLMKRRDAVFAASAFRLGDSGRSNIPVTSVR